MSMAAIVDTNVVVYRHDPRDPRKRRLAIDVLERGAIDGSLLLTHQTLVEFAAATARIRIQGRPLLERAQIAREVEVLLSEFAVLYPNEAVVQNAVRGAAAYELGWYDAHQWSYAETFGIAELLSEDLQHGRTYGHVRVRNPFVDLKE